MTEEDLKEINDELWKVLSFAQIMKVYIIYEDEYIFNNYYLADEIIETTRKMLEKF